MNQSNQISQTCSTLQSPESSSKLLFCLLFELQFDIFMTSNGSNHNMDVVRTIVRAAKFAGCFLYTKPIKLCPVGYSGTLHEHGDQQTSNNWWWFNIVYHILSPMIGGKNMWKFPHLTLIQPLRQGCVPPCFVGCLLEAFGDVAPSSGASPWQMFRGMV